jgi:four helix bundle protein
MEGRKERRVSFPPGARCALPVAMTDKPWDLRQRTMLFALNVLRLCRTLPKTEEAAEIASQLRRSGGSTGSHYWAAKRNKSDADYINKISGAIEEADESMFWLTLLAESGIATKADTRPLIEETDELISIFVASRTTALERQSRKRKRYPKPTPPPPRSTEFKLPDEPY